MDAFLFTHIPSLSGIKAPKIEYEHQVICLDLEECFGKEHSKLIWSLPWRKNVTENILRDSFKICKQQGKDIKYFLGIIRNKTR